MPLFVGSKFIMPATDAPALRADVIKLGRGCLAKRGADKRARPSSWATWAECPVLPLEIIER